MMDGLEKLQRDVAIAERMAEGMADYLRMDTLFGSMPSNMPALTLGGYLMRQHRLQELQAALPLADQQRVDNLVDRFEQTISERIVRTEERAHQEISARLRQWEEYIRDLRRDLRGNAAYYHTAVEPRAMIKELLDLLREPPFRLLESFDERLDGLDKGLQGLFQTGPFVWPEEWEPAYTQDDYWFLYGSPRVVKKS